MKTIASKMVKDYDNHTSTIKSTTRIMGYQGFSITCSINNEIFVHGVIPIEKELLDSGRPYLSPAIIRHVTEHIGESIVMTHYRSLTRFNCDRVPIKGPDSVPVFNPQTDNGGCFITKQSKNNCYAYAGPVTNRDNMGSLIANPLKSNFMPWTSFCAFFIAQPSKVHIK
ncbi:unnamed protein product [Rotaria sp. Silwood2]|nr:unnamed protein product [Rotaria sp. Silwood2]CAF2785851.1 unnamed protein product [Rotaria sp. Silwood2]CAF3164327.1 unnamed protein product [Rotaria sp. Silwood2]CAF3191562.1 unnamed protein product [Rotaria sp. Silwood2]CAF4337735.1 unnamed protein product [Rotaria sp. Silwood2]